MGRILSSAGTSRHWGFPQEPKETPGVDGLRRHWAITANTLTVARRGRLCHISNEGLDGRCVGR